MYFDIFIIIHVEDKKLLHDFVKDKFHIFIHSFIIYFVQIYDNFLH